MEPKLQEQKIFHRSLHLQNRTINEESRTVEVAFSSEEPVLRFFFSENRYGYEVLDHSPNNINLNRLNNGGAVLLDHDPTKQIGVIENARIDGDRMGRATLRFGKGALATEVWQDVVDGIRQHISVGYAVLDYKTDGKSSDGVDTYRATSWEPHEISLVSIPADTSVGVGRSLPVESVEIKEEPTVEPKPEQQAPQAEPAQVDTAQVRSQVEQQLLARHAEMLEIGKRTGHEVMAQEFYAQGKTPDQLRAAVLDQMGQAKPIPLPANAAEIGLTEKEKRQYSFVRAVNALINQREGKANAWQQAGFERELSQEVAKKMGKEARGLFVPYDIQKRDLLVGTATAGGHTVDTELLSGNFIDMLRNRMVVMGLGTQMLTGLVGNVAIPRQTGGATSYWVAENGSLTESQQAFDQISMSPKTLGAYTEISRKLLLQSSIDVEAFVQRDLATVLALEIDRVCINGSGSSNQPTGILNTSGIGSVAGGTNGAAPTWANIVGLETEVAIDNADVGSLSYLTNAKVRGKLKTTEKSSSTGMFVWEDNELNGYRAAVSNQVPSNLDKGTSTGVCSALIYGNFSDLLVGMWGGMDLQVDPYTNNLTGAYRIVVMQDLDVNVRHPESFAAMKDALTT